MPHLYFYPWGGDGGAASTAEVLSFARATLATLQPDHPDPTAATLGKPPRLRERDALLAGLARGDRASIERYWSQQETAYASLAGEMVPPGQPGAPLRFACLATRWQGFEPGTIVAVRDEAPIGSIAVFDGWVVDASHRLVHSTPPTGLPDRTPVAAGGATFAATAAFDGQDVSEEIFDHTLTMINYIAQGLSGVFPVAGPIISAILGMISQANSGAMSGGVSMMDAFAQELKANDATLETDLASAHLMTYQQWATGAYQDQWVNDVMIGDANSQTVLDEKKSLDAFVATVTQDLDDRNSELLTAVNLMMTEVPAENSNLNNPTLAMLKAPGFFFMANYVLTLGKQAFTAQLTMEGDHAAAEVGKVLAAKSKTYSKYAADLKTAVDRQTNDRLALLSLETDTGHGQFIIYDDYDTDPSNRPARYERYVWTYCGTADAESKWATASAKFEEVKASYRRLFWCGDPVKRNAAVASMVDNDAKLQATAIAPTRTP